MDVHILPVLYDNYVFLFHDETSGVTVCVDPAQARPVLQYCQKQGWELTHIINTHHHADHVGGNLSLKQQTGCSITGYGPDAERIPGIDTHVQEGEQLTIGPWTAKILFIPGHTSGHIAYHFAEENVLFSGDTLFAMGCGRLFEGTPAQMVNSLAKLTALPDNTRVYCTHEYTEKNGQFALTIEPNNLDLTKRMEEVRLFRKQEKPTIPTSIALECKTNPFLRLDSNDIQQYFSSQHAVEIFAAMRQLKDTF